MQRAADVCGWKRDALAAHIAQVLTEKRGETVTLDPSMLSHIWAGRAPLPAAYVDALPRDVRIELARLDCDDLGLMVVSAADPLESLSLLTRAMADQAAKLAAKERA